MKTVTPKELKAMMDKGEPLTLIDVREAKEQAICSLGGALIPVGSLPERFNEIPRSGTVIVYCRSGGRSGSAVDYLEKNHGFENLYNLAGGILRWSDDVDPAITKY